jgi:hypothetical protein
MQVVKTAKYIKAAQHEQSAWDAVRHQGATIGNDLLRIIQLILRHGFAFAYFIENRFGAPNFFAYRKRCSVSQPFHVYSSKCGEHQRQHKGDYGQITKQNQIHYFSPLHCCRTIEDSSKRYLKRLVPLTSLKKLLTPQVIPEGAGSVKTSGCVCFCLFWSFPVLVGRVEIGVGVKARAEPDRVAAAGP